MSGMIAAMGAACRMTNTGRLSHSTLRESPMPMPKPMPASPQSTMPMARGCRVSQYAFPREPSSTISQRPTAVFEKGGNAALTGQRPASSHRPKNKAKEPSCQPRRPAAPLVRVKRLLYFGEGRLERRQVPEALHLEVGALQRARQVEELQVVLRRARAAAVVREDAVLHALLEVGQDLLLELGRQILQQA